MADESMNQESDLWTSPLRNVPPEPRPKTPPRTPRTPKTPGGQDGPDPIDRDTILQRELEGVRNINEVVEGIISTLQRAGGNMEVVSNTVSNASTLLDTWTRILSQTEHNQRLILHPNFKGASEDLVEIEAEERRRQQALKRRAAEEEQRLEEARQRREAEQLAASAASRGTGARGGVGVRGARGRTRPVSRVASSGAGSSRSAQTTSSTSASTSTATSRGRGTSGIGRGYGMTRSRYGAAK